MGTPGRGVLRAVRAAALALVVLALSVGAHAAGGGALPGPGSVALLGLLVLGVCLPLARHRLRLPVVVAVVGGGQVVLHAALEALAPAPTAPTAPGMPGMPGMPAAAPGSGTAMAAAHAVACLLLALLLARGEAALWRLADWLAPVLGPWPRAAGPVPAAPLPVPAAAAAAPRRSGGWRGPAPRRGPPTG